MIPVFIPWRPDHGYRDRIWQHLQSHYWAKLNGFRVVIGESPAGPFNRSAALNNAARAVDWDVAVIADNDSWVPAHQLHQAIDAAVSTDRLTAAFTQVMELSQPCTTAILDHGLDLTTFGIDRIRTEPLCTQSSMLVVTKPVWDTIGGFDPAFQGYGGEDNAFWHAAHILCGKPNRVDGFVFHLWHPPAAKNLSDPNYRANQLRWRRYRAARTEQRIREAQS